MMTKRFPLKALTPVVILIFLSGLSPVISQTGDPSFEFVKQVQTRHEKALFQLPGVRAVGISTEAGRFIISVYVNINAGQPQIPLNLEGVTVRVREITGDFIAMRAAPIVSPLDNGPDHQHWFPRPVPMGISTSDDEVPGCYAGTMGFRVKETATGQVGYITNNHVAAAGGPSLCPNEAPIGMLELQPGKYDEGCVDTPTIGTLKKFIPINFIRWEENTVDAAFVKSSTSQVSNSILDIGTPVGSGRNPRLLENVKKSGRTTGLTFGYVSDLNVTVDVFYGFDCDNHDGLATFINQVIVSPDIPPFMQPGDSGSPLVSATKEPLGLLFAANFEGTINIANPIPAVLQALGVRIY